MALDRISPERTDSTGQDCLPDAGARSCGVEAPGPLQFRSKYRSSLTLEKPADRP